MRTGQYLGGLDGSVQVAGHKSANGFCRQALGQRLGLFKALGIELTLRLSLHQLTGIVDRLAVAHEP